MAIIVFFFALEYRRNSSSRPGLWIQLWLNHFVWGGWVCVWYQSQWRNIGTAENSGLLAWFGVFHRRSGRWFDHHLSWVYYSRFALLMVLGNSFSIWCYCFFSFRINACHSREYHIVIPMPRWLCFRKWLVSETNCSINLPQRWSRCGPWEMATMRISWVLSSVFSLINLIHFFKLIDHLSFSCVVSYHDWLSKYHMQV